jgi:ectoine hydroxylase-related dioxygenase (phytanoyl-CoA dioxygenase family)
MALPNFKFLEEDGFIILKNVIDSSELTLLKQDYENTKLKSSTNKNYHIINADKHSLENKIKNILNEIAKNIPIKLDIVSATGTYFDNNLVTLGWHQDHESFFRWQTAINSLNFWIPIIKPNDKEDGVMILPHSALREKFSNETEKYIVGRGAQQFYNIYKTKTTIIDDSTDEKIEIDGNIFETKVTPEIGEGDILIMRGDCIHKTDKNINGRVSLSIRCLNSKDIVDKNKFLAGGETKKRYINNNPNGYKRAATECKWGFYDGNYKESYSTSSVTQGEWISKMKTEMKK